MTTVEILSTSISFLALVISIITAYRTLFKKFSPDVQVKPRLVLNKINTTPSIVLGFDVSNRGVQSGAIDDIVLYIINRQQISQHGDVSLGSTFVFLPTLVVPDDYNIFKTYTEVDLEPFQSIAVSASSRITKYVVFCPRDNGGFIPSAGEIEIKISHRICGSAKWQKVPSQRIVIDSIDANVWRDPTGKNIQIETVGHKKMRNQLMENIAK